MLWQAGKLYQLTSNVLMHEEVSAVDGALGQASERERQISRIAAAVKVGSELTIRTRIARLWLFHGLLFMFYARLPNGVILGSQCPTIPIYS
jgi:hypothetical protein